MTEKKILVVEEQKNIRDLLQFSLESSFDCKLVLSTTADKAIEEVKTHQDIGIVICTSQLKGQGSFDLFRYVVSAKRAIDFYVMAQEIQKWPAHDGIEIAGMVKTAEAIKPLNKLITEVSEIDNAPLIEDHLRIPLDSLKSLDGLSEDIYIRFKTGRFIKLFSQGDPITEQDLDRYKGKGVDDLFINSNGQKWLIDQIDKKMDQIIGSPDALIKLDKRRREGEPEPEPQVHVMEDIQKEAPFAMEKKYLKQVHKKMDSVLQMVKKNKNLNQILANLKVNRETSAFVQTRINLLCHITACLATQLDWASEATLTRLIYCSHIHDITLHKYPRLLPLQTLEDLDGIPDLTKEERDTFLVHPEEVAKIVEMDPDAPQDAHSVVIQHHEIQGQKGFPHGLSAMKVAPFAALLSVSIDLAHYIIETPKWNFASYIQVSRPKFKGGNFTKVFKALDELSKMKKKK